MSKTDIYQAVTDRILNLLDKGTVPWRRPINHQNGSGGAGGAGYPANLASGKPYRGINVFLLACTAMMEGFTSSSWLTYKQAKERGGHVRRGEKSTPVVFWKRYKTTDKETGKEKTLPVLRLYNVFNASQCDGIEVPGEKETDDESESFQPIDRAAQIIDGYEQSPKVIQGGIQACYRPIDDIIHMPDPGKFENPERYYATYFHELAHSTGHSSRLDRGLDKQLKPFGSADYSKEELVAEMGAAFLSAQAGISPETIDQSAAYIDGWRKKIKGDKKLVVQAAGAGQRAADLILGLAWEDAIKRPANDPAQVTPDPATETDQPETPDRPATPVRSNSM